MKYKVPYFISIPIYFSIVLFLIYVFLKSYNELSYLYDPITFFFLIIVIIILSILEFINNLIFKKELESINEEERNIILHNNEGNYLYSIYKFIFSSDNNKKYKEVKKIDHGFDGIIELDNKLPIWWVHLFYITIIFSSIYLFSYLIFDFSNPYKEYEFNYKKQLRDIILFEKKIPQTNLQKSFFKKSLVKEGKTLFKENCSTCHGSDGEGNIGPNLTDNYWINIVEKDLYKNIFSMIWNGSKNNPTMRSFGKSGEIKGNDIEKISSYVYFINKDKNKPSSSKNPQGSYVNEWK